MLSNMSLVVAFVVSLVTLSVGQRPSYAGSRPIGYPDTPNRTTTEGLADRFGESDGTTPKLPIEANGDIDLIDRLSKLPIDKQPFWFINWQALEAHRNNPQTYPQRPNVFIDSTSNQKFPSTSNAQSNANSVSTVGSRFGSTNSNSGGINSNNDFKKSDRTPTSESTTSNLEALGDKFEDSTEDILDRFEVTKSNQDSSSKNNPGTKYFFLSDPNIYM